MKKKGSRNTHGTCKRRTRGRNSDLVITQRTAVESVAGVVPGQAEDRLSLEDLVRLHAGQVKDYHCAHVHHRAFKRDRQELLVLGAHLDV